MKKNLLPSKTRSRGRPREFDRDHVLDRAVKTFWTKGYSGTSVGDLTQNMGINRPSLYATFGSKHGLFLEAIDRYITTHGNQRIEALCGEPDIIKAVELFFDASIRCVLSKDGPRGCLIASVATEKAASDAQVRDKLSEMFVKIEKVIAERFQNAQDDGQLSQEADPRALARMIISITHSFSVRARVGAGHRELTRLTKDFMATLFPAPV